MSFLLLTILSFLLAELTCIIWFKERNLLESMILGLCWFFCSHILCSMALFVPDMYTLFRTIALTAGLNAVTLAAAVWVRHEKVKPFSLKKLFRCDLSLSTMLIPILICLVAVPFVSVKNEYFGMGQDEGVYQTQVLYFLNGDTARQKDFNEYHLLTQESHKASFHYLAHHAIGGYDIQSENYPETSYDRTVSPVSGIIHGIPTYSALLAMWAELFGIEHMLGIETLFYICLIFLTWCTCKRLELKMPACLCATLSAAFAPIVLWVAKASLTECFLAVIMLLFLYFLADDADTENHWLSIIPIAVFGCYHVSIYTIMPLFLMIYGGLYWFTRRRTFAVLLPLSVVLYLASFFMMRQVQPMYTMNNYGPALVGGLTVAQLPQCVLIICGVLLAVCALYIVILRRQKNVTDRNTTVAESRLFRVFLSLLLVLPTVFILVRMFVSFDNSQDYQRITLWGYICNGGILLIPLAMFAGFLTPKFYIQRNSRLVVFLTFFYCILVYSAILRFDIRYYDYFGRYLAPFIPAACIFAAMTLERFGRRLMYPALAGGLLFTMPFDVFLAQTKDDTRMEWRVLEDIAALGTAEDCYLIDRELLYSCWQSLDNLSEADVYPVLDEPDAQLKDLSRRYGRVIYVTGTQPSEDYKLVYQNTYLHSEDDTQHTASIIPMPLNYYITQESIYAAVYDNYRRYYTTSMDYSSFTGLSGQESGYCWTSDEEVTLQCSLAPGSYTMELTQGQLLPLTLFEDTRYPITLSVNGEVVGELVITEENNGQPMSIDIPEGLVTDGENLITLSGALWSAAMLNPDDTRELGFALSDVKFFGVMSTEG